MIRYCLNGLIVFILSANPAFADTNTKPDIIRGEMLYDNHCLQCHARQIHWREKILVTDLKSLIAEVDRLQRISGLEWNNSDIDDVSRYLNDQFYHYR